MPEWTVHSYLNVPALSNLWSNVPPPPMPPGSPDLKVSLVTSWPIESSLVQVTVSPTFTSTVDGLNLMSFIDTWAPPDFAAGACSWLASPPPPPPSSPLSSPPPQPAATRASARQPNRSASQRLVIGAEH